MTKPVSAGAEIDLVRTLPGQRLWAVEIKRSLTPKLERGFHHARQDLKVDRAFVVYPGAETYPVAEGVSAIPLRSLARELADA